WRFTPVDRLTQLLADGTGSGSLERSTTLPEGVTSTEVDAERARELTVMTPADRAAALAFARADGATHLDIPVEAQVADPIRVDLRGVDG
ncbi:Fe-S cluster assembly protein SufD, partial [Streptomyces scabiei]